MAATRVDEAPTLVAGPELVVQPNPQPDPVPDARLDPQPAPMPAPVPDLVPDPVPDHDLVIIESGSFARATCSSCGWSGPGRRARAVAVTDGEAHA
jgi:hypothetical protein